MYINRQDPFYSGPQELDCLNHTPIAFELYISRLPLRVSFCEQVLDLQVDQPSSKMPRAGKRTVAH